MKNIFKILALSALVAGFIGTALFSDNFEITSSASVRPSDGNDNKKRRRRGSDDDNQNSNPNNNGNSNSSRNASGSATDAARKAALKRVAGTIIKEELENEDGRQVFEFYIRKPNGTVFEVYVDAQTAEVVKVEEKD